MDERGGGCRVGIGYRVSGIRYQVPGIESRVFGYVWGGFGTTKCGASRYLLPSCSGPLEMLVSYRDLKVWQLGMDPVEQVYAATRALPSEERYGLTSQARRAAVSIPANIAEGRTRTHLGVYLHHLAVAQGSLAELETHLELARRLGRMDERVTTRLFQLSSQLGRMLNTLVRRLRGNAGPPKGARPRRKIAKPESPVPDTRYPTPSPRLA